MDSETRWMILAAGGTTTPGPNLSVTSNLPASGGYAKTTTPDTATFSGIADAGGGGSVKVNGVPATYSAPAGSWTLANTANAIGLHPGINRVQVRSYDDHSVELARKTLDVWYDDGSTQTVTGTLAAGNNTWTAANGPYLVTSTLTVPTGSTLTIEPGTSVYLGSGARIVVNGKLDAQGSDFAHIRFTREPGTTNNWADLEFQNTQQDNHLAYADIEYAQSTANSVDQGVRINASKVYLDHADFAQINRQYLDITNSSIDIKKSVFPTAANVELIHGASMLASGNSTFSVFTANIFGSTTGYNDIIDFTGGQRPGPIVQFYDNWFIGGSDDGIDLDSTDAYIEGNVFEHFHQDASRESKSHAVSTGNDTGATTEITVVRNFFYDVDHAAVIKDGASGTFINNTIENVHKLNNGTDATTAVYNLYEVRSGQYQATALYTDGNIYHNVSQMFELPQPFAAGHPQIIPVTINRSILPAGANYPTAGANITFGPGNSTADPMLVNTTGVLDPTADLLLQPKSPAIGAGPNGVDMGAGIPTGVSLAGEPPAFTNNRDATITVGFGAGSGTNAAGYLTYKYRINNGPYSAETPIGTPITLTGLADGTYTVYALGKNDAGIWQAEFDVTASKAFTVDTQPPQLQSSVFHHELPAQTLVLKFNEPFLQQGVQAALQIVNQDTHTPVDLGGVQVTQNFQTNELELAFPNLPDGRLPDGNYRATLAPTALTDRAGNEPAAPITVDFFVRAGDANHDRAINFDDLVILAQNYDTTNKTFSEGDFNYDGNVDFNDLVILAQKYDTTLQPPPAAAPVITSPVRAIDSKKSPAPAPRKTTRPTFSSRRLH
ncbi:MAG TPA: hypothetical protein VH475_19935 [Tepidisphaeraceae bacterium]